MNTFGITNSPGNHALMATVGARIRADARLLAATATFWRLLGLGGLLLLGGVGVGLASFGYSYVTDQRATLRQVSAALADALNKVTLKAAGTVKVEPDSTVKLDTSGASVRLDASGLPRPTSTQLDPKAAPPSQAKVVTDFTVFKTVKFEQGSVITGWRFQNSEDAAPTFQDCYFTQSQTASVWTRFDVASDGVMLATPPAGLPVSMDQAFANCVWHPITARRGGRPT